MPDRAVQACVFDAYGTLFDLGSAIKKRGLALGDKAVAVGRTWRAKQLEYAWTGSLSGNRPDFWACTTAALDYAIALDHADLTLRDNLLSAYRTLEAFDDAAHALRNLRERGIRTGVLSNGTPAMLGEALESASLRGLLDVCISIEEADVYKPASAAYALAAERLRLPTASIGFVSSNAWDVAGARLAGLVPVWVNRDDLPDEYGLRGAVIEVPSLLAAAQCFGSGG